MNSCGCLACETQCVLSKTILSILRMICSYASQVWISKHRLLNLQSTKSSIISFTLVPRRAMLVAKTASHLTLEDSQAARVRWDAWIWMSLRLTLSLHTCESKLNAENMSHLGFPPPKVDSSIITASYFQKKLPSTWQGKKHRTTKPFLFIVGFQKCQSTSWYNSQY